MRVFHGLAILLGVLAAVFTVLAIVEFLGYVTPAQIANLTETENAVIAGLLIVGAVGSEIAANEYD